eukprot:08569.XXX_75355_75612_1 [CDS] Oithona nana genome sequencing.
MANDLEDNKMHKNSNFKTRFMFLNFYLTFVLQFLLGNAMRKEYWSRRLDKEIKMCKVRQSTNYTRETSTKSKIGLFFKMIFKIQI